MHGSTAGVLKETVTTVFFWGLQVQYKMVGPSDCAWIMSDSFTAVLALSEMGVGTMRAVTIAGREILLCHTKDGVFALDNTCSHAYARMHEGRLRGTRLICPLHGASFDVRDGRVLGPPAAQSLVRHRVRVREGMIEVALTAAVAEPAAL